MRSPLILLALAVGCTANAPPPATTTATPAALACNAPSPEAVEGARAIADDALRARAVGAATEGKLCAATVYEATRPIPVWRVWQRDREHTRRGRWWSLARPQGTRDAFRASAVVCAEWSALNALVRCEIRAGERFALGPGQSARCEGGAVLPASPALQVYVENDGRADRFLVENCEDLGAWP
ncbi:MAG: hypothetical protein U0325_32235 [Polyangiales bacterium]